MKTNDVLTVEQQNFAAENHNLVYRFLNDWRLDENDFYDVAIFGYLRAVRNYLAREDLRKYAFSTIAWRAMRSEMSNHFRREALYAQHVAMVSLDALGENYAQLTEVDIVFEADRLVESLEASDLWNEIRGKLTDEQADALMLSADGYTPREISVKWKRPLRDIETIFAGALSTARVACVV